jgi:hypothetical protein
VPKEIETCCVFEFPMGGVSSWVVRLPNSTNGHEPQVLNWLIERFGMDDHQYWTKIFTNNNSSSNSIWKRGSICTYVYQEYWFTNRDDALETYLVFSQI